jgi:DNA-binding NarL/FixJ family response regulator
MGPIRVLIADDHTLFREGLLAILAGAADIDVVGEAAGGREAVEKSAALEPQVILMDIQMPDMNGIEATKKILSGQPETGIIILTMLEDDDSLFGAMQAGARGYVLKGADKAEMLRSIRAVAGGEALFGPAIAARLANFFQGARTAKGGQRPFPDLTEREYELLDLIARGRSNPQIAAALHITVKTVSNHISNIFNKLQVSTRAQAIVHARQAGLGKEG